MEAGYIFTNLPVNTRENDIRYLKCTSFIIIDKIYGPILFDTGSSYDTKTLLSFLKNKFQLSPNDIKWVFITHIHPDHIGANRFFRKANIILSRKDYEFSRNIANVVFEGKNLLSYLHENCPGYKKTFDQFNANNMQSYIEKYWSDEAIGINLNPKYIEDNPEIPNFIKNNPIIWTHLFSLFIFSTNNFNKSSYYRRFFKHENDTKRRK